MQETMALLEGLETSCWLHSIMTELLSKPLEATEIHTDNIPLFEVAHSTIKEKCSSKYLASIKDITHRKEFRLQWTENHHQLTNVLTKQGSDSSRLIQPLSNDKI